MINHSIRILVVDDDPDLLNGTARLLEKGGYTVTRASSGEESLQIIKQDPIPDLLLLDRYLPGIDGIEVCNRIKRDPALVNVFVVIVSGVYTASNEQAEGIELCADGYITRPIANRELLARVESYARIIRLSKSLAQQRTKELSESEQRLNLALMSGNMGMWELDVVKKLSVWNEKQFELLGMTATKEWIPSDLFFSHVHPDDKDRVHRNLQELFENGIEYKDEFRIIRENKQVCWLAAVGQVYRDRDGKPYKLIEINYDITDRKIMAEKLECRAKELAEANKELESFSYSVSHDLRAPLNIMKGFSSVLLESYSEKIDSEGQEYLNLIVKSADKMSELIDDILKLAKISRQDITPQEIDLSDIADSVIDNLRQAEPERKVEVVVAKELKVKGDKRLLALMLLNLIGNAWKYSSKTSNARIEIGAIEQNGEKVYFVRDNGAGYNMKFADRMFLPFQRMHSEREFSGSGIGLAIVKRVIQRHGGRVWGESEVGKGSTFYFTLSFDVKKIK